MDNHDADFIRTAEQAKARVPQIAPSQVDELVAQGATLIDVREAEEYAKSNIAGSTNVSIGRLKEEAGSAIPSKDSPVICYCNGGNRGSVSADQLMTLGYTNVSSIAGGFRAYSKDKN